MAKNKKKNPKSKQLDHIQKNIPVNEHPTEGDHLVDDNPKTITQDDTVSRLQNEINDLKIQLNTKDKNCDESNVELKNIIHERDHFQTQYNTLLSRISSMKSVFNKMKEAQHELNSTQEQLHEYENQNLSLRRQISQLTNENRELQSTISILNQEVLTLGSEYETVNSKCSKKESTIIDLENQLQEAMNSKSNYLEASKKELNLHKDRIQELTVMLDNKRQDYNVLKEELDDNKQQVQHLSETNSLLELSFKQLEINLDNNRKEYEDKNIENEKLILELNTQLKEHKEIIKEYKKSLEELKDKQIEMEKDVELKQNFEQECKERVLQVGKLRHEAIILNEHLTKSLAMLKQSNSADSIDKELISNLIISFVSIPRGDPKKFEVLELISSFLNWDEDKKSHAGLIHNLKYASHSSKTGNFVSMWTEFLEKESER